MRIAITKSIDLLTLGTGFNSCSENQADHHLPNVIFIMSDDHAWQAVSEYNKRLQYVAPTPNIDRIVRDGLRFDRCLVTNSICGPARATILAGKYSHLNNFPTNVRADRHFDVLI